MASREVLWEATFPIPVTGEGHHRLEIRDDGGGYVCFTEVFDNGHRLRHEFGIGCSFGLSKLLAERSRLERERDEAMRVLQNLADRAEWARDTIGEANPVLFDRLDGDIEDARALLARLEAKP